MGRIGFVLDSDDDPPIITARCAVHTMLNDLDTGAALLERALALDPTSPWALEQSGWLKTYLGQPDIAIRRFKRAIGLAPAGARNAHRYIGIGSACFDAGRYHEAAQWKRKAVLEDPGTSWVSRTLTVSYARLGDRSAALAGVVDVPMAPHGCQTLGTLMGTLEKSPF